MRDLFTRASRNPSLILGSRRLIIGRRGVHQCREWVPADGGSESAVPPAAPAPPCSCAAL